MNAAQRAAERPSTPLTEEELEAIKERADKATPGPWFHDEEIAIICAVDETGDMGEQIAEVNLKCKRDDCEFMAHARADMPALLSHIESLSNALKAREEEAEFGREIWEYFKKRCSDYGLDEDSLDILPIAEKFGLAKSIPYEPTIHARFLDYPEDFEEGDDIWIWGKALESHNKEESEPRAALSSSTQESEAGEEPENETHAALDALIPTMEAFKKAREAKESL